MNTPAFEESTLLAELWNNAIPCGGIEHPDCRRKCNNEATLRWVNPHTGCPVPDPCALDFKCAECWMVLYQQLANALARNGKLGCIDCGRTFRSVLELTDYRPF